MYACMYVCMYACICIHSLQSTYCEQLIKIHIGVESNLKNKYMFCHTIEDKILEGKLCVKLKTNKSPNLNSSIQTNMRRPRSI